MGTTIGTILRQLRETAGLNRKQLCEGICTEKYLYIIERSQRTPSVESSSFTAIGCG